VNARVTSPVTPVSQRLRRAAVPSCLAAVSGVLYFLAFPGPGLWPLGFVALVPLVMALHGKRPGHAFALGWLAGFTTTLAGFWWLLEMLRKYSGFPMPLCVLLLVLLSAYQGLRMAVSAWLYARATQRAWPADLAFLLSFSGLEAVFPLLFPWYFGAVLHNVPVLIQTADIAGPITITTLLVAVNLACAQAFRAARDKRYPNRAALMLLAAPVLFLVYGAWRIHTVDAGAATAPRLLVGTIQGNVPMDTSGAQAYQQAFHRQAQMADTLVRQGVQLVVWSESAFLYTVRTDTMQTDLMMALPSQLQVPNIVGAIVEAPGDQRQREFNSALMVTDRGVVRGRYDKRFLLPFGEYIPFGETFPKLYEWSPQSGHVTSGTSWAPLPYEDKRITALVCYEDIVPGFVNEAVEKARPHLLVNLTNDAWFGDTWEPWMHHALARLRAVEHHLYLVRATNTGVSSIIDPVGRLLGRTDTFVATTMTGEIRWMAGGTWYETLGDSLWHAAAVLSLVAAFVRRPDRPRQTGAVARRAE